MPKSYALLNFTLSMTRLWYAGLGVMAVILALFATGVLSITTALLILGILAILLVGIFFRAGVDEKAFRNRDTVRQGYVERFGPDSRQVRLYDEVQHNQLRIAFKSVQFVVIWPYATLLVVTTSLVSFMKMMFTDDSTTQANIAFVASLGLFMMVSMMLSRSYKLQQGYDIGFVTKALWQWDYAKAVRYVEEFIRRTPTPQAKLKAAYILLLAGDLQKSEQYIHDALATLTTQTNAKSKKRGNQQEQISYGQSLLGVVRVFQKEYAEAESLQLEAIQTDPSNLLALSSYAEILLSQGSRWQDALKTIEAMEAVRVKEKQSPIATQAILIAWAYHLSGQNDAAEALVQEAVLISEAKQMPAIIAGTHYAHGLMRESIGETAAARQAFIEAQKADPTGVYGQLAAAKLSELSASIS